MKWTEEMTQKAIERNQREEQLIDEWFLFSETFQEEENGKKVHIRERDIVKRIRLWSTAKQLPLVLVLFDSISVYHWLEWFSHQLILGLWEDALPGDAEWAAMREELQRAFEKAQGIYVQGVQRKREKEG